jgi:hypothetical protein
MIDEDTAKELADVYEQLRYNLELSKGVLKAVDAIMRTLLAVEPLAEPFQAKLADGRYLTPTAELIAHADLTLGVVQLKAAHFRVWTPGSLR